MDRARWWARECCLLNFWRVLTTESKVNIKSTRCISEARKYTDKSSCKISQMSVSMVTEGMQVSLRYFPTASILCFIKRLLSLESNNRARGNKLICLFFLYLSFTFLMFILVIVASEAFLFSISFLNRMPVNGSECHVQGCRKYYFTEKKWESEFSLRRYIFEWLFVSASRKKEMIISYGSWEMVMRKRKPLLINHQLLF